jgi:hypothetical protein
MNAFLDSFEPSFLVAASTSTLAGERLVVNVYTSQDADPVAEFEAHADGSVWRGSTPLRDLRRFVSDLADGLTGGVTIGTEDVSIEGGTETLEVPIGPFVVTGTAQDWDAMIERELSEAVEGGAPLPPSDPWTDERRPIAVGEAE